MLLSSPPPPPALAGCSQSRHSQCDSSSILAVQGWEAASLLLSSSSFLNPTHPLGPSHSPCGARGELAWDQGAGEPLGWLRSAPFPHSHQAGATFAQEKAVAPSGNPRTPGSPPSKAIPRLRGSPATPTKLQQESPEPAGYTQSAGRGQSRGKTPLPSSGPPQIHPDSLSRCHSSLGTPKRREFPADPGAQGRVTPVPAPSPSVTANS